MHCPLCIACVWTIDLCSVVVLKSFLVWVVFVVVVFVRWLVFLIVVVFKEGGGYHTIIIITFKGEAFPKCLLA